MKPTSDDSPLQFPTDYPIKVLGKCGTLSRERIDALVREHVPDLEVSAIVERQSAEGNFLSITYPVVARSREQVTTLVAALLKAPGVVMVL